MGLQLTSGLSFLRERGIVAHNISSSTVVLTDKARLYLPSIMIAHSATRTKPRSATSGCTMRVSTAAWCAFHSGMRMCVVRNVRSVTIITIRSPRFLSPESIAAGPASYEAAANHKQDVWALGILLFELALVGIWRPPLITRSAAHPAAGPSAVVRCMHERDREPRHAVCTHCVLARGDRRRRNAC